MSVEAADAYERLRRLQAVTDAALSHLQLDELLEELVLRVRDALGADTCVVLLLDEASGDLVARASQGLEEVVASAIHVPLGEGFAGRVAAERRPLALEDTSDVGLVNPLLRECPVTSLLGAPLVVDDQVLGVIHVGMLERRRFADHDIELLQLAADRVARGLEKALVHEKLVRLDALQREFIGLAAHELRNPAAAVHGIAATLHDRSGQLSPEQLERLVAGLYEQSQQLVRLIEQLLDLSRLESDAIPLRPRRLAVREELERVADCVAVPVEQRPVVDVPDDLVAEVDPDALERIVANLLTNAFRYGEPPVTLSARQVDSHLRITVEDRGAGVPSEFVPRLFERFTRGSTARGAGAGLGLSIARSYANALGGDLLYRSAEPSGASFQLVLPPRPASGEGEAAMPA